MIRWRGVRASGRGTAQSTRGVAITLETSMGFRPPASGNIFNHDDSGCCAANPGIGRCALLSGRGGGGKEIGNEADCAIVVKGD
jgi:hypothetical protein